jgi:transposase
VVHLCSAAPVHNPTAVDSQVEGTINKLKLMKRQMYGRANVDLLEARLMSAA